VHGANRLGTNSLLDLLVFGKSAGDHLVQWLKTNPQHRDLPKDAGELSLSRLARIDGATSGESVYEVGQDLRRTVQNHAGVFRTNELLTEGVENIKEVAERVQRTYVKDKSKVFNTARIEALELENLIIIAQATLVSAEARKESRGAHARDDFKERDDKTWLKHSLWYLEQNRMDYKPVNLKPLTVESFEPKVRVY
jgi:succinate dehydrogenase / fumarate reductase flavoprotein subunit